MLRIKLQSTPIRLFEHARQIDVRLDGQKIKQFTVGGDYKGKKKRNQAPLVKACTNAI